MGRRDIFALFCIIEESLQFSLLSIKVAVGFFVTALYQVEVFLCGRLEIDLLRRYSYSNPWDCECYLVWKIDFVNMIQLRILRWGDYLKLCR